MCSFRSISSWLWCTSYTRRQGCCDPDWLPFENHCYYFSEGPANLTEARSFCLDQGGGLSPGEYSQSRGAEIRGGECRPAKFLDWGVHDGIAAWWYEEFRLLRRDYQQFGINENWAFFPGSPNEGILLMPRLYKNVDCSTKRIVCCETPFGGVPCPWGTQWEFIAGFCYHRTSETMTYEEASQYCANVLVICGNGYLPNPRIRDVFTWYLSHSQVNYLRKYIRWCCLRPIDALANFFVTGI